MQIYAGTMLADEAQRCRSVEMRLWLLLRLNLRSICNFPISRLGPLHFVTTWRRHCEHFQRLQPDQTSRNDLHAARLRAPRQGQKARLLCKPPFHSLPSKPYMSCSTRCTASTSASRLAPLRAIVIDYHPISRLLTARFL